MLPPRWQRRGPVIFGCALLAGALVGVAVSNMLPHSVRGQTLLSRDNQDTLQYVYLPVGAIPAGVVERDSMQERSTVLNNLLAQSIEPKRDDGLGNNRSCAISSLVAQANYIFPYWNRCGYIHHADTHRLGVVSGPAKDVFCGPDEMRMWPCNEKFVRTFKRNDAGALGNCYAKIPGLTQTCRYYRECGPRTKESDWNKDVCSSDTGDYYKEPEVQRMCGICGMFKAELLESRETPDQFFKSAAAAHSVSWAIIGAAMYMHIMILVHPMGTVGMMT